MYAREAIAQADQLRPNAIDEEQKARWLWQLDGQFAETQQVKQPENTWPEDRELLMPAPVDEVYVFWLCAMIDWSQLDMQQYQIDQAMYESAYTQTLAWWRRHHRPRVTCKGARIKP